jgi:hypothetical protein
MTDLLFAREFQLFFRLFQPASFYIAISGNKKLPSLHGSGCALIAKRSAIRSCHTYAIGFESTNSAGEFPFPVHFQGMLCC